VAGATSFAMPAVAALANEIQRFLVKQTRLGVPAIVHEECLHGLVARDAVCFPQSIGLAAAWDPELLEAPASSFARQLRAMGAHQGLGADLRRRARPALGYVDGSHLPLWPFGHGLSYLEPGRVRVMVGTSSADLPCQADLEVTGETAVLARRSRYLTEVAVD
jgi:hypothetical protein